jgi:hypothetical protein
MEGLPSIGVDKHHYKSTLEIAVFPNIIATQSTVIMSMVLDASQ